MTKTTAKTMTMKMTMTKTTTQINTIKKTMPRLVIFVKLLTIENQN